MNLNSWSIQEISKKLKRFINDDAVFVSILLVLVGFGSFILGQQSVTRLENVGTSKVSLLANSAVIVDVPQVDEKVTVSQPQVISDTKPSELTSKPISTTKYVASKSGTKYHFLTCPGAKQIKEDNKIYFNSTAEAESAGYTPASNCPGL